jgi:hypothetical protein
MLVAYLRQLAQHGRSDLQPRDSVHELVAVHLQGAIPESSCVADVPGGLTRRILDDPHLQ